MISHGWDIDYPFLPPSCGHTLLNWACHNRNGNIVSFLLEHGANPNGRDGSPLLNVIIGREKIHSENCHEVRQIIELLFAYGVEIENSKERGKDKRLYEVVIENLREFENLDPLIRQVIYKLASMTH